MTGEKARFTSDRRVPSTSSWADDGDWAAGVAEGVDVVDGGLIGRPPSQHSELSDSAIEQFEDGTLDGWNQENPDNIAAVQTTNNGSGAYNGDYMQEIVCPSGQNTLSNYGLSESLSPDNISVAIRVENLSNDNDRGAIYFLSGGTVVLNAYLRQPSGMSFNHAYDRWSTNNIGGFSEDTWYKIDFLNIDWDNETVGSIEVNGVEELTDVDFTNSASSIDEYQHYTAGHGTLQSYTDDWVPSNE